MMPIAIEEFEFVHKTGTRVRRKLYFELWPMTREIACVSFKNGALPSRDVFLRIQNSIEDNDVRRFPHPKDIYQKVERMMILAHHRHKSSIQRP
jgi:hypothetical protein